MLLSPFLLQAQQKYTLSVTVKGFKSQKGTVKVQVQNAQEKEVYQLVEAVPGKTYQLTIGNVLPGKYAVNVIHDKNNNNKLDTNWLGIPTEGWGCSNDARGFMRAPSFSDKLFAVQSNTNITINLVHY
jgi:uncharacterized protein (DUF2141 family)